MNSIKKYISDEIKNIDNSPEKLKSFGLVIGTVTLLISAFLYFSQNEWSYFMLIFSLHFWGFAFFAVKFLKIPNIIWMTFAILLGNITSRLILFIIYFLIITPISLILLVSGKKPIENKFRKKADSFWINRSNEQENITKDYFEKQF